ncbi:MAG TPA: hypothetical protein VK807_23265 [Gemmatimonadaceae bacterium]|jgi:hypothetical protein|nr:hypothetical protein [Gemmatimonadaceae bacterium]
MTARPRPPRRLKVDYDTRRAPRFELRLQIMQELLGWRVHGYTVRRTAHGWHLEVFFRGGIPAALLTDVEFTRVIAAQAILGSDPMRELHNLQRATAWNELNDYWRARANVLYIEHHRGL